MTLTCNRHCALVGSVADHKQFCHRLVINEFKCTCVDVCVSLKWQRPPIFYTVASVVASVICGWPVHKVVADSGKMCGGQCYMLSWFLFAHAGSIHSDRSFMMNLIL